MSEITLIVDCPNGKTFFAQENSSMKVIDFNKKLANDYATLYSETNAPVMITKREMKINQKSVQVDIPLRYTIGQVFQSNDVVSLLEAPSRKRKAEHTPKAVKGSKVAKVQNGSSPNVSKDMGGESIMNTLNIATELSQESSNDTSGSTTVDESSMVEEKPIASKKSKDSKKSKGSEKLKESKESIKSKESNKPQESIKSKEPSQPQESSNKVKSKTKKAKEAKKVQESSVGNSAEKEIRHDKETGKVDGTEKKGKKSLKKKSGLLKTKAAVTAKDVDSEVETSQVDLSLARKEGEDRAAVMSKSDDSAFEDDVEHPAAKSSEKKAKAAVVSKKISGKKDTVDGEKKTPAKAKAVDGEKKTPVVKKGSKDTVEKKKTPVSKKVAPADMTKTMNMGDLKQHVENLQNKLQEFKAIAEEKTRAYNTVVAETNAFVKVNGGHTEMSSEQKEVAKLHRMNVATAKNDATAAKQAIGPMKTQVTKALKLLERAQLKMAKQHSLEEAKAKSPVKAVASVKSNDVSLPAVESGHGQDDGTPLRFVKTASKKGKSAPKLPASPISEEDLSQELTQPEEEVEAKALNTQDIVNRVKKSMTPPKPVGKEEDSSDSDSDDDSDSSSDSEGCAQSVLEELGKMGKLNAISSLNKLSFIYISSC